MQGAPPQDLRADSVADPLRLVDWAQDPYLDEMDRAADEPEEDYFGLMVAGIDGEGGEGQSLDVEQDPPGACQALTQQQVAMIARNRQLALQRRQEKDRQRRLQQWAHTDRCSVCHEAPVPVRACSGCTQLVCGWCWSVVKERCLGCT